MSKQSNEQSQRGTQTIPSTPIPLPILDHYYHVLTHPLVDGQASISPHQDGTSLTHLLDTITKALEIINEDGGFDLIEDHEDPIP